MRSTGPEEDPKDAERREAAESAQQEHSRRAKPKGKKGSFWRELPILIVTALVLTVLIQAFVARVYLIPSQSMEKTLHGCSGCNNDRVLVDKITYRFTDPEPGDVIVFRGPPAWVQNEHQVEESANPVVRLFQRGASLLGLGAPNEKDFVKRVIAREGDTVRIVDGRVYVNDVPLHDDYVPAEFRSHDDWGPQVIQQGYYFVMGDHRNNSSDSRHWGPVPKKYIVGKVKVRWWPLQDARIF